MQVLIYFSTSNILYTSIIYLLLSESNLPLEPYAGAVGETLPQPIILTIQQHICQFKYFLQLQ